MMKIISTTDGRFIGHEITPAFPCELAPGFVFSPDGPALRTSPTTLRFFNSNYVIDVKET